MELGVNCGEEIRKKEENILEIIPFNSRRKKACTVVRHPDDKNVVRVFCKGAPEIVIETCDKFINKEGKMVELNSKAKKAIMNDIVVN